MGLPAGFRCDISMEEPLAEVFAGIYDVPGAVIPPAPRVLDIGAHAGAYTLRAAGLWPGCSVFALEPAAEAYGYLLANLGAPRKPLEPLPEERRMALPGGGECTAVRAAVCASCKPYGFLREGANNAGEASLYGGASMPQGESVRLVAPEALPPCDVCKCDAEGAEMDFLEHYPHLGGVRALSVEWHRAGSVPRIVEITAAAGLRIVGTACNGHVLNMARSAA